jgi:hypothetical protein
MTYFEFYEILTLSKMSRISNFTKCYHWQSVTFEVYEMLTLTKMLTLPKCHVFRIWINVDI